ncbi:MAG TPA: hypothetical protein VL371_16625 [Gemmataceae bacterium]|jgi:hypothetical protein|nr:hypothetical protein [Gemmataceae bacterium]
MRIGEEQDRRAREQQILARLPGAVDDLSTELSGCLDAFNTSFGDAARLQQNDLNLTVACGNITVDVVADPELPGFHVLREGASPLAVKIGVLPGDKLFYFDVAADQYLTMEELTRRILDRVLFPKLRE